jgi:hypothetical protein
MKTQLLGLSLFSSSFRPSCASSFGRGARVDFKDKRENGSDADKPKNLSLDYDGKVTWIKGEVKGGYVYGVKNEEESQKRGYDFYDYEVRYDAGPNDIAYFEAKDCNYLTRILNEGKLRELEPDVWYLREVDNAQNLDIGEWWSQKLKLPNIGTLLENAEKLHAIATSWQEAPMEICELIANEFPFDLSSPKI